jgi:glycine cleavage system H protein
MNHPGYKGSQQRPCPSEELWYAGFLSVVGRTGSLGPPFGLSKWHPIFDAEEEWMAFVEKFLGKRVEIPEDRRYDAGQGLWARLENQDILFGLSEPALVLAGGFNDLDWLVTEGDPVREGEAVIFAITGKLLYINAPVKGTIHFNSKVKNDPSLVSKDPYGHGWLFKIKPDAETESVLQTLADDQEYAEGLKGTEGYKNPEGLKGGVSGICKAVYSGIKEQKI